MSQKHEDAAFQALAGFLNCNLAPKLREQALIGSASFVGNKECQNIESKAEARLVARFSLGFRNEIRMDIQASLDISTFREFCNDIDFEDLVNLKTRHEEDKFFLLGQQLVKNLKIETQVGYAAVSNSANDTMLIAQRLSQVAMLAMSLEAYAEAEIANAASSIGKDFHLLLCKTK